MRRKAGYLVGIFFLALSLRLAGLNWGIPTYDAKTAEAAPGLRVSFHMDEDNFLWNLTRVRPEAMDFYVPDFHWGTLQYYLIEVALLISETVGIVSKPWRESFLNFQPDEYGRVFMAGRAVSAALGSCSIFLAYGIGRKLDNEQAGVWAALILALLPLHVVNSHYLTSDITMVFFLLLAFYGLLSSFDRPQRGNYFLTGVAFGLAITAKYNAIFLIPVVFLSHFLQKEHPWSKKAMLYLGLGIGFVVGEPYALIYRQEFWGTLRQYYLGTASLPGGGLSWYELSGVQLTNMALFAVGLPLAFGTGVAAFIFLFRLFRDRRLFPNPRSTIRYWILLWASLACLSMSVLFLRHPLLRYTLPVTVFAVIPIASALCGLGQRAWGRALAGFLILSTGFLSLLQVKILTQEHTVNQAFQWVERNVPPGASITKGWPEIPVLNPKKYLITNFYSGNRLIDFKNFFTKENGQPFFPEYVLLDNFPIFKFPSEFLQMLNQHYCLVAEFKREPQFWRFTLPEWNPPHDWKYSHPVIWIYRKKDNLVER
jgi:Dolichyl-phosphate-mannose-protein mannosyltransferase